MNQDSCSARTEPTTERGRRSRLKLLRAAEQVFGQHGYEGASVADICRQADAALGSFYVYFPDKKSAFCELVDSLGKRLRHALADATKGETDRFAMERAGLAAFFAFLAEHQKLYRIVRQAEFVDEAVFRRYYERLGEGYAQGMAEAMKEGAVRRTDPVIAAHCLMGMADFLGMRWMLWDNCDASAIPTLVDTAIDIVSHGLLPRAGDPDATPRPKAKKAAKPARAPRKP